MSPDQVFDEVRAILLGILDQYGLDDVEISRDSTFHDDLGLESIDLVTVGGQLAERYGERVNLAAFLAEQDLDAVISLRVGTLVDFVLASLATVPIGR